MIKLNVTILTCPKLFLKKKNKALKLLKLKTTLKRYIFLILTRKNYYSVVKTKK